MPPVRSGPPRLTMTTPARVSALPIRRRIVSGSPRTIRPRTTFATCPKFTRSPATAAEVNQSPKLNDRKSMPSATPARSDQPSRGSHGVPRPASVRKNSAVMPSRRTPMSSGENPARAPFVATGPKPQHAAAHVPSAKPASRARGWSGVTPASRNAARSDRSCRAARPRRAASRSSRAGRRGCAGSRSWRRAGSRRPDLVDDHRLFDPVQLCVSVAPVPGRPLWSIDAVDAAGPQRLEDARDSSARGRPPSTPCRGRRGRSRPASRSRTSGGNGSSNVRSRRTTLRHRPASRAGRVQGFSAKRSRMSGEFWP